MKIIIPTLAGAAVLTACTAPISVPVPVTTTATLPSFVHRAPPRVMPAVAAAPVTRAPAPVPIPAAMPIPVPMPSPSVTVDNVPVLTPVATAPTTTQVSKKQATPRKSQAHTNQASTRPAVIKQPQNLAWLAQRLYQNQMNGERSKLVKWHQSGDFVSLGLGHFIWYPEGKAGPYHETFPVFLSYAQRHNASVPGWISQRPKQGAPWASAAAFKRAKNSKAMRELQTFLHNNLNLQANFMAERLQRQIMPAMLKQLPPAEQQRVRARYQSVIKSPGGLYPLLDYQQFMGNGLNPKERYNGKGWGLLQVLQNMEQVNPGSAALAEFMRAADDTLVSRIANAPSDYREARQLSAWQKRINTYRPHHVAASRRQ